MPDPADPSLEAALRILDELEPLARESGPVTVSAEYLADVARAEALPRNRAGVDKGWMERLLRSSREHFARAVLVR